MAGLKSLLVILTAFTFVSAQVDNDFLTVLRANGLGTFASLISTEAPDLLAEITEQDEPNITFFVPNGTLASPLVRRQSISNNQDILACLGTTAPGAKRRRRTPAPAPTPASNSTVGRRQLPPQGDIDPSNYELRETFLDNPEVVNLGPDQPLNWVSNYVAPNDNGTGIAVLQFTSGNNTLVRQTGGPFKFDKGIIYVINSWPSLPLSLTETVESAGHTEFLAAVRNSTLETQLNETPKITVFAYQNGFSTSLPVAGLYVVNLLGYSTELEDGQTLTASDGSKLTIRKNSDGFFVNGYRVVNPNVPIKNGVLHYLEDNMPVQAASNPSAASSKGLVMCAAFIIVGALALF